MPGFVINGKQVDVPGLRIINWFDNPKMRLRVGDDCRKRFHTPAWVRAICLHTTKGWPDHQNPKPMQVLPGFGPSVHKAEATVNFWSTSPVKAGAHLVIDFDGTVVCCADLATEAAYHAGEVNEVTIGIEIYQGGNAELYEGQLDTVVQVCDALTRIFGIQRQCQKFYHEGHPVPRIATGAADVVGVYGHRDVTTNRGTADPGDPVFKKLLAAGYEGFDYGAHEDLDAWRPRQFNLKQKGLDVSVDGVAGPGTVAALKAVGYPHGLWVKRPGDTQNVA